MASDVWPEWTKSNQRNLARYVNANLARDAMPDGFFNLEPDDSFLDLLQKGRLPEVVEKLYDKLCGLGIEYDLEPLRLEDQQQTKQNIRPPADVIHGGFGTCLDLALLFAGLCLEKRLLPLVVLLGGAAETANHALVAIDLNYTADRWAEPRGLEDAYRQGVIEGQRAAQGQRAVAFIRKCINDRKWLAVECTGFVAARTHESPNRRLSFSQACTTGKTEIENRNLIVALDIPTLQVNGETPYEAKGQPPKLDARWLKDYLQNVQDAFVDHIRSGEQLSLEQANGRYVELLVRERNQKHQESRMGPLADFIQGGEVRVLVFGEGGTGKTTSVLKLVADAARRALSDATQPIPFYIKLSLFDFRERGIDRLLTLFMNTSQLELNTIESLWRTGNRPCLFVMDGFNEIGQEYQEAGALALQELMQSGPHRYIVTSRPNAQVKRVFTQMSGNVVVLEIVQLNESQIHAFLVRYGADALYEKIMSEVRELASNPFLLWALAQSCRELPAGELPRSKGQIYQNLIDRYIFDEREGCKIPPPTKYNYVLVKRPILSRLAFRMTRERVTRCRVDINLLKAVRDQLQEIRTQYDGLVQLIPEGHTVKALLDEMVNNNVLREIGDALEFMHESVQDYFAAVHLLEHDEDRDGCLRYNAWDEAILLLAGLMDDAGSLIEPLASLDPFLAVQCVKGAQRVSPAALEILQAQLNVTLSSRYEIERRQAEEAQRDLTALIRPPGSQVAVSREESEKSSLFAQIAADGHFEIESPSPELIAELGTRSVADLVRILIDSRLGRERLAADQVLRSLPMESVVPALLQELRFRFHDSYDIVVHFMGTLLAEKISHHLLRFLNDGDPVVREATASILGKLRDNTAIPHLIPLLQDASPRVRRRVVLVLGAFHAQHCVALLVPLLRDKEPIPPPPWSRRWREGSSSRLATSLTMAYDDSYNAMEEYIAPHVLCEEVASVLEDLATEKDFALLSPLLSDDDPDTYNAAFRIFQAVRSRLNLPKDYPWRMPQTRTPRPAGESPKGLKR